MKLVRIACLLPFIRCETSSIKREWFKVTKKVYSQIKKDFRVGDDIQIMSMKIDKEYSFIINKIKPKEVNKALILSKQTKAVFREIYGKKKFTKSLLEEIENEPLDKLYRKCSKAGYKMRVNFIENKEGK